jgi:hypothetical protein
MRRTLAFAGLGIVASLFAHATPASACDPNRPPFCQTPCSVTKQTYIKAWYATGGASGPLPSWYELDLMSC